MPSPFLCIISCILITVSCSTESKSKKGKLKGFAKKFDSSKSEWAKTVNQEILKLGNFNWIIIAEPSFSALNRRGITTITVDATSPEVLKQVFSSLESNGHVDGKIYFSKESRFLKESDTPGISFFKLKRNKAINGRKARALDHLALEMLIIEAKEKYNILLIKTNTLLPYSSVFLELESGYWDGESETALRKRMKR